MSASDVRVGPSRLAATAAVLLTAGCLSSAGESLGEGAARGALETLDGPEGRAAVRAVTDTAVRHVRFAISEDLAPTVDSVVRRVLREGESTLETGEATVLRMEDSLDASLRGDLAASMEELIRRSIERAGAEGREELDATTAQLRRDLDERLVPVLEPAVRDATSALVEELSEGVRTDLAAAAETALSRGFRAGVQASAREAEESSLWQTVVRIAIGAGGIALLWLGAWLWRGRRRRDQALQAVAQAVKERGDDELRRHIKRRTTDRRVEGWFRDYLQARGHLVSSDRETAGPPGSGAVGPDD